MAKGHSRKIISQNIKEMVNAGHPVKQAIAASLATARKYKKMAFGGNASLDEKRGKHMDDHPRKDGEGWGNPKYSNPGFADGGSVESREEIEARNAAIMAPKSSYADGGPVEDINEKAQNWLFGKEEPKPSPSPKPKQVEGGHYGFSGVAGYSQGGPVEDEDYVDHADDADQEHERGLWTLMKQGDQGPISNPDTLSDEQKLAKMLHKKQESMEPYAVGGLVEEMDGDETPEVEPGVTSEPMSSEPSKPSMGYAEREPSGEGLSEEAKKALAMKKKKRRYA